MAGNMAGKHAEAISTFVVFSRLVLPVPAGRFNMFVFLFSSLAVPRPLRSVYHRELEYHLVPEGVDGEVEPVVRERPRRI